MAYEPKIDPTQDLPTRRVYIGETGPDLMRVLLAFDRAGVGSGFDQMMRSSGKVVTSQGTIEYAGISVIVTTACCQMTRTFIPAAPPTADLRCPCEPPTYLVKLFSGDSWDGKS